MRACKAYTHIDYCVSSQIYHQESEEGRGADLTELMGGAPKKAEEEDLYS